MEQYAKAIILYRLLEHSHIVIPNLFRDLCFDPLGGRWTVDGQRYLHSVQRVSVLKRTAVVWARSRTGTLRDDRRGVRRGRLYGMSVLLPYVILTMLLVRIPAPREKGT